MQDGADTETSIADDVWEPTDTDRDIERPWSPILSALVIGFLGASLTCLAYAIIARPTGMPGPVNVAMDDVLVRTGWMVGTATVLVGLYYFVGRVNMWSNRTRHRIAALSTPILAVAGVCVIITRFRGTTMAAFTDTFDAQRNSASTLATAAATAAWLSACAALAVLVVVALFSYGPAREAIGLAVQPPPREHHRHRTPGHRPRWTVAVAVAAAILISIPAIVVAATQSSSSNGPLTGETAAPTTIGGRIGLEVQERYRIAVGDADRVVPAGAGFVRVEYDFTMSGRPDTIEGYDGRTGERRWWLSAPQVSPYLPRSTGVGHGSVVITAVTTKLARNVAESESVIGIDAMTGRVLWTRTSEAPATVFGTSPDVALIADSVPEPPGVTASARSQRWTAINPRTGEVLWQRIFRYGCNSCGTLTTDAVIITACDSSDVGRSGVLLGDSSELATILDPVTGTRRGTITRAILGARQSDRVSFVDARGPHALLTVGRRDILVDVNTLDTKSVAGAAQFIDDQSILLVTRRSDRKDTSSIYLVDSARTVRTPLQAESAWATTLEASWTSVNGGWFALGDVSVGTRPTPEPPHWPGLVAIGIDGHAHALPVPCEDPLQYVTSVPGALVVKCLNTIVGMA
ncbi:PQQ-binding-like beta-propeller repeat protein [Gordonia sp. ABSL49_1]|uniref:outer membrane protein assembly factor BamB family protein n=1 Tax=Gordonia sp. ABSL49_1 TaxID=2920941 RepID=UPI001F0E8BAB|nr:PQQ-binding-like beta-propeller repeat protein [Gordonia sp. ABSL49_1]MCH5644049.1 PQQ-like beta-propeller repeat protein [Gordonia sp. ABSL49_1]